MNEIFENECNQSSLFPRRDFIDTVLKAAGASALLAIPGAAIATRLTDRHLSYTVQDVINIILKEIPGAPFAQTVDTLKSGKNTQPVTGIVTTMFCTMKVIEEAVKRNANFVIAHEPTFYNHLDDTQFVPNNSVVKKKQEALDAHGIVVWRFHDYWHTYRPDGISYGVVKAAGWLSYYQSGKTIMTIPPVSLNDLIVHLKSSLGIAHLRMIGDPALMCSRIALLPGAGGGKNQISTVEKEKPDVLIVGEVSEWETAEYIRDAIAQGSKVALIILGHSLSEEPGMQWLVEWLGPKVPGLTVSHAPSGEPFTWV